MNKIGQYSYHLPHTPSILSYASTAGKKEGEGPWGAWFDLVVSDTKMGERTWEKGECSFQKHTLRQALKKASLSPDKLDLLLSGDLLNQCTTSSYAARDIGIPFFGLYGACSTMAESLALAAMLTEGGFGPYIAAMTSSHFCTAERQYRMPLEYGSQRTPTAQWTATGCGAVLVTPDGNGPYITHVTIGSIQDWGIKDPANMGAAMAPAAYATLRHHFKDTGRTPEDYDLIVTGDLGSLGMQLVRELAERDQMKLGPRYNDCGVMLYDTKRQQVACGGSGCGCSALMLTGPILRQMEQGILHRVLFCGTGALHSPLSLGQKESIPGICHAVALSTDKE